jgi:hypothetical protein
MGSGLNGRAHSRAPAADDQNIRFNDRNITFSHFSQFPNSLIQYIAFMLLAA